ncbi:MAG: VWA domain-containing protein [Myxococcota bacterium]
MFLDLFFRLRSEGVPVSIQEWQTLMTALEKGLHQQSLMGFYSVARACLVKTEAHFDAFDRVFAEIFEGVEGTLKIDDKILEWLREGKKLPKLTDEQLALLEHLDARELMRRLEETLRQQTERHDGGDRWVGTGGRSPYGHGGQHPTGIRVGGEAGGRSAMKVAEERRYIGYRTDVTLDVRQLKVALRRLRELTRVGDASELDIDGSIDATCKNAGEIELLFRPPRRNNVRLLLLMDVGGTMDPYTNLVSRLVTALRETHGLREVRKYYFHNCIYDRVYNHPWLMRQHAVLLADLFAQLDDRWKVLIVGDAAMHPAELLHPYGAIDTTHEVETTGVEYLQMVRRHFKRCVWLNPDPPRAWYARTTQVIGQLFPMYHLSVEGLQDAVKNLVQGGRG